MVASFRSFLHGSRVHPHTWLVLQAKIAVAPLFRQHFPNKVLQWRVEMHLRKSMCKHRVPALCLDLKTNLPDPDNLKASGRSIWAW